MDQYPDLSETAIRVFFIQRVDAFCELTGMAPSTVTMMSIKDSKFYTRVRKGDSFRIDTYQRVLDWMSRYELNLSANAFNALSALEDRVRDILAEIGRLKDQYVQLEKQADLPTQD